MSFLKRAIQDGIRKGVGDAIGRAVQQAVEPTATKLANQAATPLTSLPDRHSSRNPASPPDWKAL